MSLHLEAEFMDENNIPQMHKGLDENYLKYIKWLEKELIEARKQERTDSSAPSGLPLLVKALEVYGLSEIRGDLSEGLILEMFDVSGHGWVKDDSVAWCSAFMNWVAHFTGFEKTKKLNARSWLNVGKLVKPRNEQIADVLVLWRVSQTDWRGHVGLYIGQNDTHYYVLGGNQQNQVKISQYPKNRLLGIRRLQKV